VNQTRRHLFALATITILILVSAGCSERDPAGLKGARATIDPLVFDDDYSPDVYFQAFLNTHLGAVEMDSVFAYGGYAPDGSRSLKITVPPDGSALGAYAGGVLTSSGSRDLADFNALTFYARASENVRLNEAGFGNDNTGTSLYGAGRAEVILSDDWTFVVVPIPAPSKVISERGLFMFAEGLEPRYGDGYFIWIDEIKFARLDNITNPQPRMAGGNQQYFVGSTAFLDSVRTEFDIDGAPVTVNHAPAYFDFESSDPSVAVVTGNEIRIVGVGESMITGTLEGVAVRDTVVVSGHLPPPAGATPPSLPAADVVSMFSDVYVDVPVDTWNTYWNYSTAQVEDYVVAGDNTKMYSTLNFVGIEFMNPPIDATEMTHFNLDVYAPAGTNFKVKLVAFDDDGGFAGETQELIFDSTTTPAFNAGDWSHLDIPLEDFELTVPWENIGQLVLSTDDAELVLVDNVYWHK